MRLYRMELYKLYHNKIFRIGLFAATALLLAYFWFAEVGGEIAAVDGSVYSGYEAVKMNKKITKEFEGELTDEKVHQIVEKYGLPSKLEENMPGWRDGNFLNDFVTRYFTNAVWPDIGKYTGYLQCVNYFCRGEPDENAAADFQHRRGKKKGRHGKNSRCFDIYNFCLSVVCGDKPGLMSGCVWVKWIQ